MLTRALLVLLVVLNVGVGAWWVLHAPAAVSAAPPIPRDVPQLQLVRSDAPASTRAPVASRCFRFGPFASATAFEAARSAITPQVLWTATAQQPIGRPRGWRVLLPQPDRVTAVATAARIGAAGFGDYLVMPDGGVDANAIALGRYGNETAARERAAALAAAGFPAIAEPVGVRMTSWLDVAAPATFAPLSQALGMTGAPIDCTGVTRDGRYTIPGPA